MDNTKKITLLTATVIAIADMIGIGIFTSLGFQVQGDFSPFSILMLWTVGGVAALCGALSYSELAAAFPSSGGEYNFLSRIYHPSIGFTAGWISATVGFSAPIALAAFAFGEYSQGISSLAPSPLVLAILLTWFTAGIQLKGLKASAQFQNISTLLKVLLVVVLIFGGLIFGTKQEISFTPSNSDLQRIIDGPFFVNLVFVMFAYAGWNAATYIANEVQDKGRNVPISMIISIVSVVILYILFNAVILLTTPISAISGQIDVALIAAKFSLGELGAAIVAFVICFGLISSISAMIWMGSRVIDTMSNDHKLLHFLFQPPQQGVPTRAIIFLTITVTIMLLTQSFEAVLNYIQFSLILCSFLTVLGVIILRISQPDLPRPYKVFAYPFPPLIYLAITGFILFYLLQSRPVESLLGLITVLLGFGLYFISQFYEVKAKWAINSI